MIDSDYLKLNRILAAVILLASFGVYLATMAPTVSYWDCGEFIATAYTLGVPHPPGSPLYLLIGRIFSMAPLGQDIGFRVNLISPIVSALAVMFLYLIIVKVVAHWRKGIQNWEDALIAFGGALVGALTFAFTDSHWFNAVEAEVYSVSTFFTAIVVWLILHWSERADDPGNERYILIIAYIMGLASGVHLLNLLTLPFIALIIYFRKYHFQWKTLSYSVLITGVTFLVIHNGIIKGLPKLANIIGLAGVALVVIAVFGAMVWSIVQKHQLVSVALTSVVLILVGYSSYTLIFIRSNQNPGIDENDPETVAAAISYLEREQYGSVGQFPRRYKGLPPKHEVVGRPENGREYSSSQNRKYMLYNSGKQWNFFWDYQVRKMYVRYFLWQFAGRGLSTEEGVTALGANARQDGVDWTQFGLPLALLLGMVGMIYHFYRDKKEAFTILTLFFLTGLAIILYLNQDNPQPRERDYSYVGSFLAFSVWIGVGAAAIGEKILQRVPRNLSRPMVGGVMLLMVILIPGVMVNASYHEHDRSGSYVAWDYSYNLLQSCEPNGILFTNGDNDTFPLWYLQEVEGIRKDVIVANLSLLNTPWYIRQLRDSKPPGERFIHLSDDQIKKLTSGLQPWKTQRVKIPVTGDPQNPDGFIEWELKPTFANSALRVQDMMILRIISDARWRYPIYFAVTVSQNNRIGMDRYLNMEGLTFRLKSRKTRAIDAERMTANLMTKIGDETWSREFTPVSSLDEPLDPELRIWSNEYQPGYLFRNLGNEDVFYNPQVVRLLQNYRSAYMQLAVHHFINFQSLKREPDADPQEVESLRQTILEVMETMEENVPENTIWMDSKELYYQIGRIYGEIGVKEKLKQVLDALIIRTDLSLQDRVEFGNVYMQELADYQRGREVFEDLYSTYQQMDESIQTGGLAAAGIDNKTWAQWQKIYSGVISSLVHAYRNLELYDDAELILTGWLDRYPEDKNARSLLEEVQNER